MSKFLLFLTGVGGLKKAKNSLRNIKMAPFNNITAIHDKIWHLSLETIQHKIHHCRKHANGSGLSTNPFFVVPKRMEGLLSVLTDSEIKCYFE